jgi:hypothetical protein
MKVTMIHGAKSWMSSPTHPNYAAAASAIQKVFGCAPDFTREGGSIPITTAMEEATGMNVLLLPVGACDDMAHSQNEKYNVSNLMNGAFFLLQTFALRLFGIELFLNITCCCSAFICLESPISNARMTGIKVLGLYLHELGQIKGPKPSSCRCVPLTDEELMVPGAFVKGFRCKCEM